ncbi:P-loop nucleoside triphosphate hydrolase superfamily protein [Pelomyxa schiedti]|nr:P-loop nucleoside triphosphate hydrolase superfamily protein [Pelomyxa schiedti]
MAWQSCDFPNLAESKRLAKHGKKEPHQARPPHPDRSSWWSDDDDDDYIVVDPSVFDMYGGGPPSTTTKSHRRSTTTSTTTTSAGKQKHKQKQKQHRGGAGPPPPVLGDYLCAPAAPPARSPPSRAVDDYLLSFRPPAAFAPSRSGASTEPQDSPYPRASASPPPPPSASSETRPAVQANQGHKPNCCGGGGGGGKAAVNKNKQKLMLAIEESKHRGQRSCDFAPVVAPSKKKAQPQQSGKTKDEKTNSEAVSAGSLAGRADTHTTGTHIEGPSVQSDRTLHSTAAKAPTIPAETEVERLPSYANSIAEELPPLHSEVIPQSAPSLQKYSAVVSRSPVPSLQYSSLKIYKYNNCVSRAHVAPTGTWPSTSATHYANVSFTYFTQLSMSCNFSDGKPLDSLILNLRRDPSYINKIPPIHITEFKGQWYSLDNRRLYCYKTANIPYVPAIVVPVTDKFFNRIIQPTHLDSIAIRDHHSKPTYYLPPSCSSLHWILSLNLDDTKQFLHKIEHLDLDFSCIEIYSSQWFWIFAEECRTVLSDAAAHLQEWCNIQVTELHVPKASNPFYRIVFQGDYDLHPSDFVIVRNPIHLDLQLHGNVVHVPPNGKDILDQREHSDEYEIAFIAADVHPFLDCKKFPQTWCIARVTSISPFRRVFEALSNLHSHGFAALESTILAHILHPSTYNDVPCSNLLNENICSTALYEYLNTKFNSSQFEAIKYASCLEPVAIIQGRIEKYTTTIIGLLSVLLARNERVVLCSPSNIAVDDVAIKILSGHTPIIGANGSPTDVSMVMIGSEDNKDLDSPVGTVFLDYVIRVLWSFFQSLCRACEDLTSLSTISGPIDSDHPRLIAASSLLKQCHSTAIKFRRHFSGTLTNWLAQLQTLESVCESLKSTKDPLTISELVSKCSLTLQYINARDILIGVKDNLLSSQLVLSTLNSAGSWDFRNVSSSQPFDTVIVDECGQSLEPEIMLPLRFVARRLVLVGDWKQLPTLVESELAKGSNYDRSMIERMVEGGHHYRKLTTQYRMHPLISAFASEQFYEKQIVDSPCCLTERSRPWHTEEMFGPLKFFHVDGVETRNPLTQSLSNSYESHFIKYLSKLFFKQHPKEELTMGVITPYSAQCCELRLLLSELSYQVEVNTVDGFQGRERDVVIVSTVRSNDCGSLGFLKDFRRLNVALTRARLALWVVGNACTLRQHPVWNAFIVFARDHDSYIDVRSYNIPMQLRVTLGYLSPADLKHFNGPWVMHARDQFYRDLRQLNEVQRTTVGLHLQQLCQGRWPKHPVSLPPSIRPLQLNSIIHLTHTCGKILVWCIDVEVSETEGAWQIISVFGIVAKDCVEKAVISLQAMILDDGRRSGMRLKLRKTPPYEVPSIGSRKMNMLPQRWDTNQLALEQAEYQKHPLKLDRQPTDPDITSKEVSVYKYFKVDTEFITSILEGALQDLPMSLSVKERELVSRDGPIVVCGRSGTGKTTVLLYRMLMYELQSPELHPRQIFVTVSPSLCAHAQNELQTLLMKHNGTTADMGSQSAIQDLSFEELEKGISLLALPESIKELQPSNFPLFVTYRKLLTMIDAALPRPFRSVIDKNTPLWCDEVGAPLADLLHQNSKHLSTPETNYIADQSIVELLKNEAGNASITSPFAAKVMMATTTTSTRKFEIQEVDFTRFSQEYWVHFDQNLTAGLDSATVWIEIQSAIKGNVLSILPTKKSLTLEQYCEMCSRRVATIKDPTKVYKLFLKYEKEKGLQKGWDMADFTLHVYQSLQINPLALPHIDFVYIDEVQDCNMAQLALLKFICPQPSGYSLVGDTAQTIHQGVNFHFEALKDMFFEIMVGKNARNVPQVLFLARNYRTHAGICRLANVITETIIRFFPNSIDKLPPESAPGSGNLRPIFLRGGISAGTLSQLFRFGRKDPQISFGAGQVMLVRNQEAKKNMLEQVESGLVLTILEAKGLEFNHVLLVNFWHDSIAKHKWRTLVSILKNEEKPTMVDDKLLILCSELKHLYTAITRARRLLVMVDDFYEEQHMFADYLAQQEVISLQDTLTSDQMDQLASESHTSPEEWKNTAFKMMTKGMYTEAASCFHFAGDVRGEHKAISMKLVKEGKSSGDGAVRKEKFLLAAQNCLLAGDQKGQAKCFELAEEYLEAVEVYKALNDTPSAVTCLISAHRPDLAFELQIKTSKDEALDIAIYFCAQSSQKLPKKEHIDALRKKALDAIKATPDLVTLKPEYKRFVRNSALLFKTIRSMEDMQLTLLLLSDTERIQFLIRYNHTELIIQEYLRQGKEVEAAELLSSQMKYEEAGKLFDRAAQKASASPTQRQASSVRAAKCFFYASYIGRGCKKNALQKAYELASKTTNRGFACELKMRLFQLEELPPTMDFEKQVTEEFPRNVLLQKLLSDLSLSSALKQCCKGISFEKRIQILTKWGFNTVELIQCAHQWHSLAPVYGENKSYLRETLQDYYMVHQCPDGTMKLTDLSWLPVPMYCESSFLRSSREFAQAACISLHTGLNLLSAFLKHVFDSEKVVTLANLTEALSALCAVHDIYLAIVNATNNDLFCTQLISGLSQGMSSWYQKLISDVIELLLASPTRTILSPLHHHHLVEYAMMKLWSTQYPYQQIKGFRLALELQAGDILSKWNLSAPGPEGQALSYFALANSTNGDSFWYSGVNQMITYLGRKLSCPDLDCRDWLALTEMVLGCTVGATNWFLVPPKWYAKVMKAKGPTPLFRIPLQSRSQLIFGIISLCGVIINNSAAYERWISARHSKQFWFDIIFALLIAIINLPLRENFIRQQCQQLLQHPGVMQRCWQFPALHQCIQQSFRFSFSAHALFRFFLQSTWDLSDPLVQIVRPEPPILRVTHFQNIRRVEWRQEEPVESILPTVKTPAQSSANTTPSNKPQLATEIATDPIVTPGKDEEPPAVEMYEDDEEEQPLPTETNIPEVAIKPWIKKKILSWYLHTKKRLEEVEKWTEEEKLEHQLNEMLCSRLSESSGSGITADQVVAVGLYTKELVRAQKLKDSLFSKANELNDIVRKLENDEENLPSIKQLEILDEHLELLDGAKAIASELSTTNEKHYDIPMEWLSRITSQAQTTLEKVKKAITHHRV